MSRFPSSILLEVLLILSLLDLSTRPTQSTRSLPVNSPSGVMENLKFVHFKDEC